MELTEEQVHAIFTERQKREDKKIDKLLEVIESLKAEVSASKTSKPEGEPNPYAKELAEQKAVTARLLKESEERTVREKAQHLDISVRKALGTVKTNSNLIEHAVVYLKGTGAVRYDSEGELVMNGLPLHDGIKEWAKTDEAKIYLSAKGTAGTGSEPKDAVDGNPKLVNGKQKLTKKELGEKILAELRSGELFSG